MTATPSATPPQLSSPIEPDDAFTKFNAKTTLWYPENARSLVYAADLAYQSDPAVITACAAKWGFDRTSVIDPTSSILQAYVMANTQAVVVAFRGTRPDELSDWMADFEICQSPFSKYFACPDVGATHDGFTRLLAGGWKSILATVMGFQNSGQTLWITGHSLGGALSVLAAAAFTFSQRMPVNGVYTFGQPRVGDINFCTQSDSHFGDAHFRFVNNQDIVTRVPPRIVPHLPLPDFYGHSGQLRFFDASGKLFSDDNYWNSFLINVEVGFANMKTVLDQPVADHDLIKGYALNIEKYLAAGTPPLG